MKRTLVVAASRDPSLPADEILRAVCKRFGGKCGGRPDFAQGACDSSLYDETIANEIIREYITATTRKAHSQSEAVLQLPTGAVGLSDSADAVAHDASADRPISVEEPSERK